MIAYIIRRILLGILTLWLVTVIVFIFMNIIPGDPIVAIIGQSATKEQVEMLRKELWLDRPLVVQYQHWLSNVIHGDLGKSIVMDQDLTKLIRQRLPVTLHLSSISFVLCVIFGVTFGVICAIRRGKIIDSIITVFANIGIATPIFWLGMLGIYYFSLKLAWLPVQGYTSPFENFWQNTKQIIMPIICLTLPPISGVTRQTRSSVLEVVQQDYIRTAWSKGLKERTVVMKHVLKNSLIPVVTMLGFFTAILIGGSVLVETVFNIPGMGRLLAQGAINKDIPVVQAGTLLIGVIVIAANLCVDLLYGFLDPRIRYE